MPLSSPSKWHIDVDRYLNPVVPASVLPRLPHAVSHFLGYRSRHGGHGHGRPHRNPGNVAIIFWAFIGIFASLVTIGAVNRGIPGFQTRAVPTIIGSFGAAAVLDFYAIESPLAQPRNAILGQLIACITGISISKLLALHPDPQTIQSVRWVSASLSCACATALMALTGTVHPPAGATALMAVLEDDVSRLGWYLILPVMLGCGLMLVFALLVNNIQRRFPFYWWTPEETGGFWRSERRRGEGMGGVKGKEGGGGPGGANASSVAVVSESSGSEDDDGSKTTKVGEEDVDVEELRRSRDERSSCGETGSGANVKGGHARVVVCRGEVHLPHGMNLRPEEIRILEMLSQRL